MARERIADWVCTWAEHLAEGEAPTAPGGEPIGQLLRRHEGTGRPLLGERPFLQRIPRLLGRDLIPPSHGDRESTENGVVSAIRVS